jgi:hypothetical protein
MATLAATLLPSLAAQAISGTITPTIANPGQTVTLAVTGVQAVTLPDPCIPDDIRVGGPGGTIIVPGIFCIQVLQPLGIGQVVSGTWTVPSNAAPGAYWMRVRYFDAVGVVDEYFCLEVRTPPGSGPTVAAQSVAQVGQTLSLSLADPSAAGFNYLMAASFTSTVGIPLGPSLLCLDPDVLFGLTFPTPLPGIFNGFQGTLDATGTAGPISIVIPNDPGLAYFPIKIQAVVPTTALFGISNTLNLTIAP